MELCSTFAVSDNFYGSTIGPSSPGHIILISGQAIGALPANKKIPPSLKFDGVVNGTLIGDIGPKFDDCSRNSKLYNVTIAMQGKNLGDLNTSGHPGKLILDPTTGMQNSTAAK
jgi:phospholipase C